MNYRKFLRNPFTIIFVVLMLVVGCNSQTINFNFSGKKVLYSNNTKNSIELVLLNLVTNEEIIFSNFDEVERSTYILFDEGKKIFVNEYNSTGKVYIYDILKDSETDIDIHSKNKDMSKFYDVKILDNNFYFASNKKIFVHSLNDFSLINEYTVDSIISQFSVHDKDLIMVNYFSFDTDTKALLISNLYLFDFKNNTQKEFPFQAYLYGSSNDGNKLLFNSQGPKIMNYPSYEISTLSLDSVYLFREMLFVSDDEIIFSGFLERNDFSTTNLYLLDLKSGIIQQVTNSESQKEIKSTSY